MLGLVYLRVSVSVYLPETLGIVEIEHFTVVIGKNEWEDRVLHEVIETSSSFLVEFSEVLEVSNGALFPPCCKGVHIHCCSQKVRKFTTLKLLEHLVTALKEGERGEPNKTFNF